jgi:hypothetical protein
MYATQRISLGQVKTPSSCDTLLVLIYSTFSAFLFQAISSHVFRLTTTTDALRHVTHNAKAVPRDIGNGV